MLSPGKKYPETTLDIDVAFTDADGTAVDPVTVTFETMSPCCTLTSYVYGTASEVSKASTGNYTATIVPDLPGRWRFRWIGTGTGTAIVEEGNFLIQDSVFVTNWPCCTDYC